MTERYRWMDDETEALEKLAFDFFSKEATPNEERYRAQHHVEIDSDQPREALAAAIAEEGYQVAP